MAYKGLELGSLDSEIVGVLNCLIVENNIKKYIEPYIGFGSIIGNIQCENKYGSDPNKYIVALLNYLSNGGDIPESMSLGEYEDVKAHYHCKSKVYSDWYYGLIGFALSGADETKPFHSRYITQDALNDAYLKLKSNIENHRSYVSDTVFTTGQVDSLSDDLKGALIYCKIPKYKRFSADKFLNKLFELSKHNYVVLRTESIYSEFELLWEEYTGVKTLGKQTVKLYRIESTD